MKKNKKKIIAMLLFIFMSLFMFMFANPNGEIELESLRPTMTLEEKNIYQIEVFDKIPEFKASAVDSYGKKLKVTIKHDINREIVGKYTITFTAEDNFDNKREIKKDFNVVDTTRPLITLIGNANYKRLVVYETYVDEGANVTDNYDPPLKINGVVRGITTLPGTYTLRYNHTDANGNSAIERIRSIKMLAWNDDEDGDGYSNLEEYNEGTDYDDPLDFPNYDKGPSITIDEDNIYQIEVYDDIPEFKATASDPSEGVLPVTITHNIDNNNLGTYKVTFKATDSLGNVAEITRDFKVVKRKITVTADNKTSIYGDTLKSLSYTVTSGTVKGTDTLNLNLIKSLGSDVGEYPITITESSDNLKYDITLVNGTYTITPKELTEDDLLKVSFKNKTYKYNGKERKIEVKGLPTWASVTYDDNTRTDVGSQPVTATITGSGNYTGSVELNAKLTITKVTVIITALPNSSKYKEDIKPLKFNVLGTVYGTDDLNINISTTATPTSNVGLYPITIKANNSNYNIITIPSIYRIKPKTLEKSDLGSYSFKNGTFVYNGKERKIEVKGLSTDFKVTYDDNTRTDAGSQTVTATITGNKNYTGSVKITAKLTIIKASVVITALPNSSKYKEDIKPLKYHVLGTIYGTDDLNINISTTATSTSNVGLYPITITANNNNYNITTIPSIYTITPKKLDKSDLADNVFKDGSFTYDGTKKSIYAENLPAGFTATYKNNTRTNAGDQTATATIKGNSNYTGSITKTATLTITKAPVTLTAENKTSVFGSTLETLTSKLTSGTVYGTDNLNVSLSTTALLTSNVGTYPITITASNDNYNITLVNGTYTITAKTLEESDLGSAKFENGTFVYDGTEHKIEVTGLPTWATVTSYVDNTRTIVGNQTAKATITGSGNYTGTVELTATLTITAKTLQKSDLGSYSFANKSFTYDGNEHKIEVTGLPTWATVTSYVDNTRTIVGNQTAKATITGSGNYTGTVELTATLTITKAVYDMSGITFTDKSVTYDGNEHAIVIGGTLPAGVTVSYTDNTGTNAGIYNAIAKFTGDTTNYELIPDKTAKLTITAKTLQKSDLDENIFPDGIFVYDGTVKSLAIVGTLPSGVTVSYTNNNNKDVGTYTVKATFTGSGNYTGTVELIATLTITKAVYDMSGITFTDKSVTYDGNEHAIVIGGTLPAGVTVSYTDNTGTNVGIYNAIAKFTGDTTNYELIPDKTAKLTIAVKTLEESDLDSAKFENGTFVYDGNEHSIVVTDLPTWASVTSYDNNTRTIVGEQTAKATITGSGNYTGTVELEATLKITKATYDMSGITFTDKTVTYDGTVKSLEIVGTLPTEVTVSYTNNTGTNVGTYNATAKFTHSNTNYNTIGDKTAILTINKANPTLPPIGELSATKGDIINTVTLPDGYTYKDSDIVLSTAGNYTANIVFTPSDTTNYNIIETTTTIYVKDIFTVTFKSDTTTLKTENVVEGNSATAPANPTKTNWTFTGWNKEFANVQSNLTVNAVFSPNKVSLRAEIKDNAQLLFTQNISYNIKDYINVYVVYANGTEQLVTEYNTDFSTTNVVTNKTLYITHDVLSNNTLKYTVIADIAFQTKFEVLYNPNINYYYKTISSYCKYNCDKGNNIEKVYLNYKFIEIIEHYAENISVSSVKIKYTTDTNYSTLNYTDVVRWSRVESNAKWDPVRIGTNISDSKTIDKVSITYTRAGLGTYTIIFQYNSSTGKLTAIDETKIN